MKKLITVLLVGVLCACVFASCGKASDEKKITVAASSTPHAEILEQCKASLKEKGYELEVRVMTDYVTPNTATEDGEVDANFFQHTPYLEQFNDENNTHLVSVGKVHYEPYAIYAGKTKSLDSLPNGSKIAIPNDSTNEARALLLLESTGLIKLKDGADLTVTVKDIVDNPKKLDIKEMEAALIPGVLDELECAVINGNYALDAGLKVSNALAVEDEKSTAAQTFANILVVKKGNESSEKIKALIETMQSDEIATYIKENYNGAVLPIK